MGWTYFYAYGEKDKKALMTRELEQYGSTKVLKCSMVGNVYYAACVNSRRPDVVYGLVCLTSLRKGDFGYKDMTESMGPCYYDCPLSILALLTPTDERWAIEWRSKCLERAGEKGRSASRINRCIMAMPLGSKLIFLDRLWIKVSDDGEREHGEFRRVS